MLPGCPGHFCDCNIGLVFGNIYCLKMHICALAKEVHVGVFTKMALTLVCNTFFKYVIFSLLYI